MTRRSGNRTEAQRRASLRWSSGSEGMMPLEWTPARWELLLDELKLTEREPVREIELRTDEGIRLRQFIRSHCAVHFVPEAALEAAGVRAQIEVRMAEESGWRQPKLRSPLGMLGAGAR